MATAEQWEEVTPTSVTQGEKTHGEFRKFVAVGDTQTGIYKGARTKEGKFGMETLFDFAEPGGGNFTLKGTHDLVPKLKAVPPGTMTKVTFIESKDLGFNADGSPKAMKLFRVEVAKKKPLF